MKYKYISFNGIIDKYAIYYRWLRWLMLFTRMADITACTVYNPRWPMHVTYRQDVLELLSQLLAGQEDVQLGKMMGHPVFYHAPSSRKRKMFACVYGPGVALKLPPQVIDGLLEEPGYAPFAPMAKPMTGWLVIHRDNPAELAAAVDLIQQALDYVASN